MLLLLVITLLFAITTGEGVVYRMTYFLAVAIIGSYVCVRLRLRGLEMRLESKCYVAQVGDRLKVQIYLHNNSRLPTGWLEIMLMSNVPGNFPALATAVSAGERDRLEISTFCCARGVYTVGPILARTSDPLGLFWAETLQGSSAKVVLRPATFALPYLHLPPAERSGEERPRYRSQAQACHVATIREYACGDSVSQIHWLSTAKHGQLMSKEFDAGGSGEMWVVVDLERRTHCSQGTERTDEYAVGIAASLADLLLKEGRSVGLIARGDHEYVVPLGYGTNQMSRIMDTLILSKTEGDDPLATVLAMNTRRFGRSASLSVVTSSASTEWVLVLRELRYRGASTMVLLVDASSFGGEQAPDEVLMELASAGIPTYVARKGGQPDCALSRLMTSDDTYSGRQGVRQRRVPTFPIQWDDNRWLGVTAAGDRGW